MYKGNIDIAGKSYDLTYTNRSFRTFEKMIGQSVMSLFVEFSQKSMIEKFAQIEFMASFLSAGMPGKTYDEVEELIPLRVDVHGEIINKIIEIITVEYGFDDKPEKKKKPEKVKA